MNSLRAFVAASAVIPVLLLAACSPISLHGVESDRDLSPASAASPATPPVEESREGDLSISARGTGEDPSPETVEAAHANVQGFLDLYSASMSTNSYTVADFEPLIASDLLESLKADDGQLLPGGYHSTGDIRVAALDPESWNPATGTLRGFACEDRADLRVFDASGTDITPADAAMRFESDVTITGLPDAPRLVAYTPYPELDAC